MASNDREELASALGAFLLVIKKGVESSAMDTIVRMDLTLTQVRVVMVLKDNDADTPISEIADRLGLSLATAGRAVDHLVNEDMATRWEDPADRRSKLVRLTNRAEEITEAQQKAAFNHIRAFAENLPGPVADQLLTALRNALAHAPDTAGAGNSGGRHTSADHHRPTPVAASP